MTDFLAGRSAQRLETALGLAADPAPFVGALAERLACDAALAAARLNRVSADIAVLRDAIALRGQGAPSPLLAHFDVAAIAAAPSLVRAERSFAALCDLDVPKTIPGDPLEQGRAVMSLFLEAIPKVRDPSRLTPFLAADIAFARALAWRRPLPIFVGLVDKPDADATRLLTELLIRASGLIPRLADAYDKIEAAKLRSPRRDGIIAAFASHAVLSIAGLAKAARTTNRNARRAADTLTAQNAVRELSGRGYSKVYSLSF